MHGKAALNLLSEVPRRRIIGLGKRFKSDQTSPPSALHERFTSLVESNIDSSNMSSLKNNPEISKILKKYSQDGTATFDEKYQSDLLYVKLEKLLARNKHAREIADTLVTPAWRGTETVKDANLRMIIDTAPKKMKQRRIITPPTPFRERIHNAKEGSLDYKLSRISQDGSGEPDAKSTTEDDKFKELYKERLLGPMMFMNSMASSGIGLVTSMADVRINEQIDRSTGKFEGDKSMDSVRGKPLSKEHLANCTDTNYFMNQILQKEECLPPWIESQKGVNGEIERLRYDLDKSWSMKAVEILDKRHGHLSRSELVDLARTEYQQGRAQKKLFDSEYHNLKLRYLQASIKDINMKITTYNLSCPSPNFHKWKLIPEKEMKELYSRVLDNIDIVLRQRDERQSAAASTREVVVESQTPSFEFFKAVKSLVMRK